MSPTRATHQYRASHSSDQPDPTDQSDAPAAPPTPAATYPPVPPASRESDADDVLPPPAISGRGPMDQTVPDIATGTTPVTRRDD